MLLALQFLFQKCSLNAAQVISCSEQALSPHGRAEGGAAVVKASLALTNHWGGKDPSFFSLKALCLPRKRSCWNQSSLPEQASQFTVTVVELDIFATLTLLKARQKHSTALFELSVCDVLCAVVAGPPLTQSSLISSREQPGTSAVPSLAPVGARLPPPLPQNLLYTVAERKQVPLLSVWVMETLSVFSVVVWLEIMICLPPIYTNLKRSLMALPGSAHHPLWDGVAAVSALVWGGALWGALAFMCLQQSSCCVRNVPFIFKPFSRILVGERWICKPVIAF